MKISELIKELEACKEAFGDVDVCKQPICDSSYWIDDVYCIPNFLGVVTRKDKEFFTERRLVDKFVAKTNSAGDRPDAIIVDL